MAGHSQFKNIMYRKGAQDKKRAKLFTKTTREIIVAVKEGGAEPTTNARLRAAIAGAREVNMPKDNIERAIKRASGGDDDAQYVECRYEGYGPGGVAVIVDALTDNKNRTAADVRATFTKYGGNLGETGSVSFQFERVGEIIYPLSVGSPDHVFEMALEAGAQDVQSSLEEHVVTTSFDDLNKVREFLTQKFGEPRHAAPLWKPLNTVSLDEAQASSLLKMIDVLDDYDDVQQVSANFEIDDAILQ